MLSVEDMPPIKATPVHRIAGFGSEFYAKLEWHNPFGSVKDRAAYWMLRGAVESGELREGMTILEASSGNMGISLAAYGRALGVPVEIAIPEPASMERQLVMEAYGAKVVRVGRTTDDAEKLTRELKAKNPQKYYVPNQFDNPLNTSAHYDTTGAELIGQVGSGMTHFVACIGTCGTIIGVSKRLRDDGVGAKVIGVEPPPANIRIYGTRNLSSMRIPKNFDEAFVDERTVIANEQGLEAWRELVIGEGLDAGISSGAAMHVALRIAGKLESGGEKGKIAVIFADGLDRYLSTPEFRSYFPEAEQRRLAEKIKLQAEASLQGALFPSLKAKASQHFAAARSSRNCLTRSRLQSVVAHPRLFVMGRLEWIFQKE